MAIWGGGGVGCVDFAGIFLYTRASSSCLLSSVILIPTMVSSSLSIRQSRGFANWDVNQQVVRLKRMKTEKSPYK